MAGGGRERTGREEDPGAFLLIPPFGLTGGGAVGSGLDSHRRTILGPHLGSIGREGQYSEKIKKE